MKKYTKKEFDAIQKDGSGVKHCPTGDYTAVILVADVCHFDEGCQFGAGSRFAERCHFAEECHFGVGCRFAEGCHFDKGCYLGKRCRFDEGCHFGAGCHVGAMCRFAEKCDFAEGCHFDWKCHFAEWCYFSAQCDFAEGCHFDKNCYFSAQCDFAEKCEFGEKCAFEDGCTCEFGEFFNYLTCGGYGTKGRTTYFWIMADGGIMVRCGCFHGSLSEWKEKVRKIYSKHDPRGVAYIAQIRAVKAQEKYVRK